MKIPTIQGVIRRRMLVNYRIDREVVQALLPEGFRVKTFSGFAIGGICLIRLEEVRPKGLPGFLGISSENAAHRFAVEWEDEAGDLQEGVFVPRRDTNSQLNVLTGGRIFPGVHHHAEFSVKDADGRIDLMVRNTNQKTPLIEIRAEETGVFPEDSVFGSLEESSKFFEAGSVGYSPKPGCSKLEGLLLKVSEWTVRPLAVKQVRSSFFDDRKVFPAGSVEFDHALLMRDIPHEWSSAPEMKRGKCRECGESVSDLSHPRSQVSMAEAKRRQISDQ
jgi:hypothetical protein